MYIYIYICMYVCICVYIYITFHPLSLRRSYSTRQYTSYVSIRYANGRTFHPLFLRFLRRSSSICQHTSAYVIRQHTAAPSTRCP